MNIGMGLRLLETLTSALYEDPIVFFREYVQNSVDAYISNPIDEPFKIEIDINSEEKNVTIRDNGYGISPDKFIGKMTDIGKSDKATESDQIGFRGIGRISAMPFCKQLLFTNKVKGSSKVQIFCWEGEKYLDLLEQNTEEDLNIAITKIVFNDEKDYNGDTADHFFKVEIKSYSDEIKQLIDSSDFEARLCILLPLNYSQAFKPFADRIASEYKKHMNQELTKYQFNVYLNDQLLLKPFTAENILESDIVFWPLQFKKESDRLPAEKVGLLWFTFNRKVTSNNKNEPRGIWVRSKNMLVGNQYSLAETVSKSKDDYISTFRDLTQTLNGVYGEMLIDTLKLSDNARRDWFKIDSYSIQLRQIIADFLRKLVTYRRSASNAFNDPKADKKKRDLIEAYTNLTKVTDPKDFIASFQTKTEREKPSSRFEFAEDDIPHFSITLKKFYDKILFALRNYCLANDKEELKSFLKIRAYLKNQLNENDDE